ncbi:ABC transporter substrate-binding protein [Limobrevibacterium gyesilva]|uniref:ABC transporter substrate-binding protein n=1 Tax=Limobrevibacterium gyesilva TaxID=2991712 RepID=A0AA41YHW5_9PROT|nr:ABC transporter substrate-binding protein [Limobrevibacterium gyesilva]MCW3473751.1 ABC transporter substrate-binding protein [Limobrevibacterium gyesilva]
MRRRTFLAGAAGSSLARPALAQGSARVLRFAPEGNLANPDPIWTTTTIARNHGFMIWDQLYGQNRKGVPSPQMAKGHELSDDKLTWRFTLRRDLTFHDNEPVLARDCVPSILRWAKRRGLGQKMLSQLDEIRALDDRRFEIRLKKPYPLMLTALGTDTCFIMPERIARTDPFTQISEYVGSGPYRFLRDEWVAGSRAAYGRFDKYVPIERPPEFTSGGKVANFDRVEWIVMPDPATASAALQRGEIDWWQNPLVDLLPALRAAPGVQVMLNDTVGVVAMIAFNHLHPPFDNRKLLRALLPAVDQDEFMQAAMGGDSDLVRTGVGVFTPGLSMANDAGLEVLTGPRDGELARQLVRESGYAGERVVLMSPSDYPTIQALVQVTRDLFQRVGLNVDYVSMDWGTLVQRRTSKEPAEKGGWNAFCTTYEGLSVATPASHFPIRGNGRNGWFGWPESPRIEALRDAWFDAPDVAAQRKVCEDIQRAVWEEVPYIPVGQWFNPTAMRSNIQDVVKAPYPIFWGVKKA